jgi:hypothetical protein
MRKGVQAMRDGQIKVGIGFATGRKNFQKVLKTNIINWEESGLVENQRISLNLLVAYDLTYQKTRASDYTRIPADLSRRLDDKIFISSATIRKDIELLVQNQVITANDARLVFGKGYAAKRNAVLFSAIKHGMDYLIFLDDDEYPMAVTNTRKTAVWSGQHVVSTHLKYITRADITHGNHCGYISPIPYVEFNDVMTEDDFRLFIEAISNDIVKWEKIRKVMNDGGVTYADTLKLISDEAVEVPEIHHAKFISGANLCLNLTAPGRLFPFYNPPGARGEDTFLSTCLQNRFVYRVPCYTFHDGFSTYNHLLDGVLPIQLKFIKADSEAIINRFYKACIGWIRYKPLLVHITQPDRYEKIIADMQEKLALTLPKVCAYFGDPAFMNIQTELQKYHKLVSKHHAEFLEVQRIWARMMDFLAGAQ